MGRGNSREGGAAAPVQPQDLVALANPPARRRPALRYACHLRETCPISTEGWTRRVQFVREGRGGGEHALLDAWLLADPLLRVRRGAAPGVRAAAPAPAGAPAPAPAPAGAPRRPGEPCAARLLNAEGSALRDESRPPTCAAHRAA